MKDKPPTISHIDLSLKKVFDFCKNQPDLKYICDHFIAPMESGIDA